jgi:hypothetical protein
MKHILVLICISFLALTSFAQEIKPTPRPIYAGPGMLKIWRVTETDTMYKLSFQNSKNTKPDLKTTTLSKIEMAQLVNGLHRLSTDATVGGEADAEIVNKVRITKKTVNGRPKYAVWVDNGSLDLKADDIKKLRDFFGPELGMKMK